jgi:hypothetical protein
MESKKMLNYSNRNPSPFGMSIIEHLISFPKKQLYTWGIKMKEDMFEGQNLLGRLLMELRDKGCFCYSLPADALYYLTILNAVEG